ncbi:hypothetical protein BH747_11060 [Enterococcus villorum]|uniref:DUF2382 domain-containing protein n=1 Tax=Enterococcus villorum TaxID=112904 RepID=A0A1V8Y9D3_9ENTE|nr:DUF2382 domain-containing protein [Enterococcus villorum]OQO68926.1 hypothetical protein BH747_11060 [Enterococcus villorum]OQO76018.1 hypothetical protein BH744_05490 [Enterococcus villorum]
MRERDLTVIGSYSTREEALSVIEQLRDEGYNREDIIIYTTKEAAQRFGFSGLSGIDVETDINEIEGVHEDRSLWERIKDAFSTNTYEYASNEEEAGYSVENDPLYQYRYDIAEGKIVITVKNYRGATMSASEINTDKNAEVSTNNIDYGTDDDTIQLKEEQLDVNTHDVTTGEVDIHKHVVNDTKTIEVPVKREEIVIERKPVNSETSHNISDDSLKDETITIPIKEEQIDVNKHTVVREEVGIHKKEHEDIKQVTEDVSREELDVDTKGDVQVDDTREKTRNPEHP